MNDRLKNTILCSLLLARKYIIILLAAELITAALMLAVRNRVEWTFAIGTDILPVLLTMLAGMSFFERHNAFCAANAVSKRNRIISTLIVSAVFSLLVAVVNCIAWGIISDVWLSIAELVRRVSRMRMISGGNIPVDMIELFFFSEAVFFLGYFFGGLRYSKGSLMLMITLIISAVVMTGSIFLESVINFTPAMVIMYIPALIERTVFTAVLFSIILAAAFLWCAVKLSEVTVEKRRGD